MNASTNIADDGFDHTHAHTQGHSSITLELIANELHATVNDLQSHGVTANMSIHDIEQTLKQGSHTAPFSIRPIT